MLVQFFARRGIQGKIANGTYVATNKVKACKDQKRMDEFRSILEFSWL